MGDAKLLVKLILVEFRQMYIKHCRLVFKLSCFNDGEPALSLNLVLLFWRFIEQHPGKRNNLTIAHTHWLKLSRIFLSSSEI